jgi:uncharacterized membrane protein
LSLYNRYILTVSICLLLSTVIMIAVGLDSLQVYFTIYVFEALVVTELYVYFNRKAHRALTYVTTLLFAGFIIAMGLQIYNMLT